MPQQARKKPTQNFAEHQLRFILTASVILLGVMAL